MVSIEGRSRQICDRLYFNNRWWVGLISCKVTPSHHQKIWKTYCCPCAFLFQCLVSIFKAQMVWNDFVNVKLLGIDKTIRLLFSTPFLWIFSNGAVLKWSQLFTADIISKNDFVHSAHTLVFSVPTCLFVLATHICFESVQWMWETQLKRQKLNQPVTWTLEICC